MAVRTLGFHWMFQPLTLSSLDNVFLHCAHRICPSTSCVRVRAVIIRNAYTLGNKAPIPVSWDLTYAYLTLEIADESTSTPRNLIYKYRFDAHCGTRLQVGSWYAPQLPHHPIDVDRELSTAPGNTSVSRNVSASRGWLFTEKLSHFGDISCIVSDPLRFIDDPWESTTERL